MKALRFVLAFAVLGLVSGLAYVAQQTTDTGAKIAAAANDWLGTLDKDQRAKATFTFDSKERTNWNFIPLQQEDTKSGTVKSTRKGLPLEDMSEPQKKAALAMVKTVASAQGAETALTIMGLEAILRDVENPRKKGGMYRDPNWYFFTVFGTPSKSEKWGLRIEGHHLSLNFTLEGTQVVSATPYFFGANPAVLKAGDKKGQKVLDGTDDIAAKLFESLDADQKKVALQEKHFDEPGQKEPAPKVGAPVGITYEKLNDGQKGQLMKLIQHYTERMPQDVGEAELKRVKDGGVEKIHFAFTGTPGQGKPHTYRVQGPTFVIEFLNIQADGSGNPANHIHSCWRRLQGDFGL